MLSLYFQKNHLYRTGSLAPPSRALAFNDDDWSSYSDCGLNSIYGASNVTVVNSETATTAVNYISSLQEGYEFVHLMAHSCPWGHTFKVPSGMAGTVMAPEIAQTNPNSAFIQLFSCSNARWLETGCLGNWYLFGTDMGLLVSGATKTGSMLDFEYFYNPVASGSTFGEAFREWWSYQAQGGFSSYERAWFYGCALLGDPTLRPMGTASMQVSPVDHTDGATDATAVSTSSYSDCFPAADTHAGVTAVAWLTGENGRLDIAARFFDDSSDSWSQVYVVDADEYWDNAVSVCFDDSGVPWLAWSDFEYSTYSYRIKTARGIPFESVETAVALDGYQVSPDLAYTDRMWLAWQNWESAGGRILITALDGSFPPVQLSQTDTWSESPAISRGPDGKLHAVWVDQTPAGSRILWAFGDETGFTAPSEISSGSFCHSPHIALAGDFLVAVWQSDGLNSSVVSRIFDGSEWTLEEEITSGEDHFINPVVCPSPDEPIVCWQEGRSNAVVMASVRSAEGWSTPFQPVIAGGPAWSPVMSGGRTYWAGTQGADWNIYCDLQTGTENGNSEAPFTPMIASNPVQSFLSITLPSGCEPFSGTVTVYDVTGRVVIKTVSSIVSGEIYSLDVSGLPGGIYSLLLQNSDSPVRFTLLH